MLIFANISFTNIVKSKEELGSPSYFKPICDMILFVISLLYFIADLTEEYMALIAFVILVLIFFSINFCQKN